MALLLHFLNAVLLSAVVGRWLDPSGRDRSRGLIAGAVFLVMPAGYEILLWTFFLYKIVHVSIVLASLLIYERFLANGRRRDAAATAALLLLSFSFYEASLPIGLAMIGGLLFLKPRIPRDAKAFFSAMIVLSWIVYGVLFLGYRQAVLSRWSLSEQAPQMMRVLLARPDLFARAAVRWLLRGMLLDNSGAALVQAPLAYHLYTVPRLDGWRAAEVLAAWGALAFAVWKAGPLPWRRLLYAACALAAGSILALCGRFAGNEFGTITYLEGMSMYQYFPSLCLAAGAGLAVEHALDAAASVRIRRMLCIGLAAVLLLLGRATRDAVGGYVALQEPLAALVSRTRSALRRDPAAKVFVAYEMPQAPRYFYEFDPMVESYHAFRVLFGPSIVATRARAGEIIGDSDKDIPARYFLAEGLRWRDLGFDDDALDLLRAAVERDPRDAEARRALGFLLDARGDESGALRETGEAVRLDPSSPDGHFNLGRLLMRAGMDEEAAGAFQSYLRLKPDAPDAAQVRDLVARLKTPRAAAGK